LGGHHVSPGDSTQQTPLSLSAMPLAGSVHMMQQDNVSPLARQVGNQPSQQFQQQKPGKNMLIFNIREWKLKVEYHFPTFSSI
jgi:hypothetical protein